jgi:hypothetical protein
VYTTCVSSMLVRRCQGCEQLCLCPRCYVRTSSSDSSHPSGRKLLSVSKRWWPLSIAAGSLALIIHASTLAATDALGWRDGEHQRVSMVWHKPVSDRLLALRERATPFAEGRAVLMFGTNTLCPRVHPRRFSMSSVSDVPVRHLPLLPVALYAGSRQSRLWCSALIHVATPLCLCCFSWFGRSWRSTLGQATTHASVAQQAGYPSQDRYEFQCIRDAGMKLSWSPHTLPLPLPSPSEPSSRIVALRMQQCE